ncbi:hypothetical protein ACLOJK_024767 [Asimina triloba]
MDPGFISLARQPNFLLESIAAPQFLIWSASSSDSPLFLFASNAIPLPRSSLFQNLISLHVSIALRRSTSSPFPDQNVDVFRATGSIGQPLTVPVELHACDPSAAADFSRVNTKSEATPKSNTLSNKNMTAHIESMQDQGMNVPAAKARKSSLTSSIDWLDVLCKVSNQKPAFSYPNIMGSVRPLGCLWIHTNQPRNSMQESLEPAKTTKSVVAVDDTGKAKIKRKKLKGKRAIVRWLKFFRYKKKKEYERMTAEEKILYKLKKAQRKEERLAQALQKIEPPDSSETTHDPEILTPEEHFYYLKMGHKCKNYVPIGRRGIFQGVILNMHLHWKKHQTLKVMVKTFTPEEVRQIAVELARLSGGIVLDIHEENTIIMYRGKNYCQPPTEIMSPKITLSKKKVGQALDKSKYRDGLRAVRNLIPRLERDLEVLQVQMNQERDNKVNAASEKCPANIDSNNHEEIPGHHLDHLDGFAEIMSGNENLSEDDSFSSGALSDSEALSDIFETDSDEDEEEKAEPALYLDEFEKFPVDHKEEPEDFEEHLRQISINAKKSGSSEKDAKLPDLDEVLQDIMRSFIQMNDAAASLANIMAVYTIHNTAHMTGVLISAVFQLTISVSMLHAMICTMYVSTHCRGSHLTHLRSTSRNVTAIVVISCFIDEHSCPHFGDDKPILELAASSKTFFTINAV